MVALRTLPDASVDAVVTDPPYGISFMGQKWDDPSRLGDFPTRRRAELDAVNTGVSKQGGRQRQCSDFQKRAVAEARQFQAWVEEWAAECLRVLKPGGYMLAFGGTRMFHRLAAGIEDAGFELRDTVLNMHEGQTVEVSVRDCPWLLAWSFGSGFPKSLDVSKAIDKAAGAEREVISQGAPVKRMIPGADQNSTGSWVKDNGREFVPTVTAAATEEAAKWQGWGTALKPAFEPIVMARKPLMGTVADNVMKHGTGALNIDGCRIEVTDDAYARNMSGDRGHAGTRDAADEGATNLHAGGGSASAIGRWPANLTHDGSDAVLSVFPAAPGAQGVVTGQEPSTSTRNNMGLYGERATSQPRKDEGSAARFFYCPKASRADRHEGLEDPGPQFETGRLPNDTREVIAAGKGNHHPTVKPTELMRYLVRLVTPPGGVVLDPFMGSGSTLKAAELEGFDGIGIEREAPYIEIARRRVAGDTPLFANVTVETAT